MRINVFKMVDAISKESISEAQDTNVELEGTKDLEPQLTGDEGEKPTPAADVGAAATGITPVEPGPAEGGGDGTAETVDVNNVQASDHAENHVKPVDQTGLGEVADSAETVGANDNQDLTVANEDNDGLDTVESGEVETLEGEADDLVMDIDNAIDETDITEKVDAKIEEAGEICEDAEGIKDAVASVERYIGILEGMRRSGREASPELLQSISIGLEAIDQDHFLGVCVSNEDAGAAGFDTARDATQSGLTAKAKQLWEALKKAVMRAFAILQDVWTSMTQNVDELKDRLKALRSETGVLQGGKEMKVSNTNALSIKGEWVGDSPDAIRTMAATSKEALLVYPSNLAAALQRIQTAYKNRRADSEGEYGAIIDGIVDVFNKSFVSFDKHGSNTETVQEFASFSTIRVSPVMPGNKALVVAYGLQRNPDGGPGVNFKQGVNMGDALKQKLADVPGTAFNGTVRTPSREEANAVIKALEEVVNNILARNEGQAAFKKLVSSVRGTAHTRNEFDLSKNDFGYTVDMIALGITEQAAKTCHALMAHLYRCIKAYIAFLEAAIRTETGGGDTINA